MRHKPCLLLNADYFPLQIIKWKQSILYKVEKSHLFTIAEHYDDYIRTPSREFALPAVMALKKYINTSVYMPYSKKNVYYRDEGRCQYCYKRMSYSIATIDHVIPVSKWKDNTTPHTYENVVIACKKCNIRKGNQLLSECNMSLDFTPKTPTRKELIGSRIKMSLNETPEEWRMYLK